MKTLKITSALIITLILLSVNAGFAKNNNDRNPNTNPKVQVNYEVVVHFGLEKSLCNTYQIEILDAKGAQVAPAQIYVPEKTMYKFDEQTNQLKGVRIARLVMVPFGPHYICENELFSTPDVKVIEFQDGTTYRFDLYPRFVSKLQSIK